jgi:CRISPR-associated protein Cmr6
LLCQALGGKTRAYVADWHFATGLGNPHPTENGFLWHPTLGVPYIPGAAVKGLVRAWVEAWMFDGGTERLNTLYRWFGSEHKDFKERRKIREGGFVPPSSHQKIDTEAGAFIFFDALPISPVTLSADVMTPHMGDWYAEGDQIQSVDREPNRVPADWHDPVPVPFLVATEARFQFCVAPRGDAAGQELDQIFEVLRCALEYLGGGAKTAAGYGRLSPDDKVTSRLQAETEQLARAATEAEKSVNQRAIDALRTAFAKVREFKHREGVSGALYRQVKQLLDEAGQGDTGSWPENERTELADLVAREYPDTLNLGGKEKEVKRVLRSLRGEL